MSAAMFRLKRSRSTTMRFSWQAAPNIRATSRFQGEHSREFIMQWSFCRNRIAVARAISLMPRLPSTLKESACLSSAAATQVRTALVQPIARAPEAFIKFTGDENGNVKQLHALRVGPPPKFEPIAGSEFTLDVDLVLLAMGFLGPIRNGMIEQFGVALDQRGNIAANAEYMTSVDGIFAAGDMRRGQSLVVWAISEGRKAAAAVDRFLAAKSS